MLQLHLSNRIEALADALLLHLAGPREDLFAAEQLIVPSLAMKRWLTLRTADALGICTQLQFHYLAQWLWTLLRRRAEAAGGTSPGLALTPPLLAWRLWRLLGDDALVAQQPRLAGYLAGADEVMRCELAERIAALFDQLLTYRADWIEAWSAGQTLPLAGDAAGDQSWQAALWRRVAAELALGREHPLAALVGAQADELPAALHLFALPSLAPLHAELLQALGRHTDVHVWALNPCREYWFELIPPRRFGRLADAAAAGHEVGHPLLAAWGRQTQAAIDTLLERCPDALLDDAGYAAPSGESLLVQLHNGILELTPPTPATLQLAAGDRSIELHRCHSLARELEVLHDRLLGLMHDAEAAGTPLHPGRIVVVTPDLAAAAPMIDAVFGTMPLARRIPYTISGLGARQASAPARVLLALLSLVASRAPASELFALLHEPLLANRFGVDEEALGRIERWLIEAGLHGGIDAAHRAAQDLAGDSRHTLADAVERLLLGHLLPDAAAEPFGGVLGCGGAEGSDALALGALARYAEALQRFHLASAQPLPPARWCLLLHDALDVFVAPEAAQADDLAALQELHQQLDEWAALPVAGGAGEGAMLSFALVRHTLGRALDAPAHGGVAGGAVTFAAMSSLRNLPFDVVCAIGLDGTAFPSAGGAAEFDLLAAAPRRGDRQRRLDERNLFLDLVLAARTHLHLSCSARSARDNTERPPSVLVDELLDFLVDGLASPQAGEAERERWRAQLVVDHPLQAFAHAPFLAGSDPRQRSRDAGLAQALREALAAPAAPEPGVAEAERDGANADTDSTSEDGIDDAGDEDPAPDTGAPFFRRPLAAPDEAWRDPTLDDLTRFFVNPSRYLLRERLQLAPLRDEEQLDDQEPALLDRRAERALAARLLPRLLAGADDGALGELALAGPEVPSGALGRHQLGDWLRGLRAFGARVQAATEPRCLPACEVDFETAIDGERWAAHARWADARPDGLVRWRFGALSPRDQIEAWLAHLMLCHAVATRRTAAMPRTIWLAGDATLQFDAVADTALHLESLLRLYRKGLVRPLPFHLRCAEIYLRTEGNLDAARTEWQRTLPFPGEGRDPARQIAWRGVADPLDEGFQSSARVVFGPLLQCARRLQPWQALPEAAP